jgi:hypothetical protein
MPWTRCWWRCNGIIACGIAATRNAAGLPFKRAGFVVVEIGAEHPLGSHAGAGQNRVSGTVMFRERAGPDV